MRQSSKISSQVEERGCHLVLSLTDGEARVGALHDKGGALLGGTALLVRHDIGDSNNDKDVCVAGVGDEDLGTVQDPITGLGVLLCKGLLTLCIGAGTRLGQAESTQPLAAAQLRQILCLLLGSTIFINRSSTQLV